jgi:hypothetical protein
MPISPIATAASYFSLACGDDPSALAEFMRAAYSEQMRGPINASVAKVEEASRKLSELEALDAKLATLAPIDGSVPKVRLGDDFASCTALKNEISETTGSSLPTEVRNDIGITTWKTGNVVVSSTPVHLATEPEQNLANSIPVSGYAWTLDYPIHKVTNPDGSYTNYIIFLNSGVLTATKADVDALRATIATQEKSLGTVIANESTRIKAAVDMVLTACAEDGKDVKRLRQQEYSAALARLAQLRADAGGTGAKQGAS